MSHSTPSQEPSGQHEIRTVARAREFFGQPQRVATLCYLLDGERVLLAMKKRSFGAGRWNGAGGKVITGETVEHATIRETEEEIGVTPQDLEHVASLDFYFPHEPTWNQRVEVFLCRHWVGEPRESDEMAPRWHSDPLPYTAMWSSDLLWFPRVLAGEHLDASFVFAPGDTVLDSDVRPAPPAP